MAWLLRNEVKNVATESRIQLLLSEKEVRNTIYALRERIEACVRTAEKTLLQDLQDIVQKQEEKIDNLEKTTQTCVQDGDTRMKRSLIMERLSFQPASVTFVTNKTFERLLEECTSLGTVVLAPKDSQIDTPRTSRSEHNLNDHMNSHDSMRTRSNGYVIGRIAQGQVLSKRLGQTNAECTVNAQQNTNIVSYEDIDAVRSGRCTALNTSDVLTGLENLEEIIPKTIERRRKNALRKSATMLMRERRSLDDIKEENVGNSAEDQNDRYEEPMGPPHKVNCRGHNEQICVSNKFKDWNMLSKYQSEELAKHHIKELFKEKSSKDISNKDITMNDTPFLQQPTSKDVVHSNGTNSNPCDVRGRQMLRCPVENSCEIKSEKEKENVCSLKNADLYSDVFVSFPNSTDEC